MLAVQLPLLPSDPSPYLAMWASLNALDLLLCLGWAALAALFAWRRRWLPAVLFAALGATSSWWCLGELLAVADGVPMGDPTAAQRMARLAPLVLTGLVLARPPWSGRSLWAVAPLVLAIHSIPMLVLGMAMSARRTLEVGAPGRRAMVAALLLFAAGAGAHAERIALRGAFGAHLGMGLDAQVVAAEWVADGATVAAWAAVAAWLTTTSTTSGRAPLRRTS